MTQEVLSQLRAICMALPEVVERPSHGEPTWFINGKRSFVMFADRHHDDRVAFWCAAPVGIQQALVADDPNAYFRPPYVGHRGWLGVYLDRPVDWGEIASIVREAYLTVSPKRLASLLEDSSNGVSCTP